MRSCCSISRQRTRGAGTLIETVKRTAERLFVPFTVGGGIRSAEDAEAVFTAGADKVSINSSAIDRPALIGEIGASFGAQAVIVAIDARRGGKPANEAEVFVSGGRKPTGLRVVDWAKEAEQRGAGEILLTSMDTDGMRNGFDCELTRAVSEAVQIPVIASGGAGSAAHFAEVFHGWQGGCGARGEHLSLWSDGLSGTEGGGCCGGGGCAAALLGLLLLQGETNELRSGLRSDFFTE